MLRNLGRAAALAALCFLLVFAPELLSAVAPAGPAAAPQRVLLRAAICADDGGEAMRLLRAYQKAHPAVHLRVQRVAELSDLTQPLPDVLFLREEAPALPLLPLPGEEGRGSVRLPGLKIPVYFAVCRDAQSPEAALSLLSFIQAQIITN